MSIQCDFAELIKRMVTARGPAVNRMVVENVFCTLRVPVQATPRKQLGLYGISQSLCAWCMGAFPTMNHYAAGHTRV